ncbi:hypothetical protein [Limnobacter profundi]|uniref:Uncharacterized protein n=1 Tax=Limnobacter profundi TaxID=2732163 RepID=A0ABX6N6N6_9BURK|nr:hypothetical protein [Limnobacter sp. SAORIC-580]QJR30031.1 hypothetical protein HKT17_10090 [Limnobacter sp. SAORIC-580]
MSKREIYENGLLSIRFTGEQLKTHGVSIYDLSESLLAIQRIIHKAYLAKNGRLKKGAFPAKEERPGLALQLGERRRSSDAFALVPILADPTVQENLKQIIQYVVSGVVGYYTGNVLDRIHKEKDDNKKIFIGSIYTEVANIVNRIDTSGGVEGISLGSPLLQQETVAAFTSDTKDYLVELKGETYLGSYKEIKGRVYKLYPASNIVAIRRSGGNTVTVFLTPEDFETVRYHQERNPLFLFKGHPIYKFGIETKTVTEFEADAIVHIEDEER